MRTRKAKDRSRLIQAAMGEIPCRLTIGNVRFFNVFTGEVYPAEVDILDGFVVRVRQAGETAPLPSEEFYDGGGNYLIPGFIDTHMHVESTMMIPENLSRAILPWGTTTICTDPHEIANVMGIDGVRFMLKNAGESALRQYVLAPSCVPSVPGMEGNGASLGAAEVGELLDMDGVVGIAEIMDFVGVCRDSPRMHGIIDQGERRGMYLQGHAPALTGQMLAAYRLGGPLSDHESVTADEVREKLRCGIHVNLRASSLIDDLTVLVDGFRDHLWQDFVSICTDDVHAGDLLTTGHINRVVRKAVEAGLDGRAVVKMATLNAAREYHFDDLGAIAPGYIADMQLVGELDGRQPAAVFAGGRLVAENGQYLAGDRLETPHDFPNTVNIPQIRSAADFRLRVPEGWQRDAIPVRVLTPKDQGGVLLAAETMELPVRDGAVDLTDRPELLYAASVNRYGSGDVTIAVCRNFGLDRGALASTIAHDSHNLTVAYRNPDSAFLAVEKLRETGGGICAVDGRTAACLPLPVAGLMSQEPCGELSRQIDRVQAALNAMGGGRVRLLQTAILSLAVLPGVVITDKGLVDGLTQTFLPVFDI